MGQDQEYISIAEFAERAGVSKQAVYQRLNKSLKAYVKVIDGKKSINIRALEDLYGKDDCSSVEQDIQGEFKGVEQGIDQEKEVQLINKLIDTLQDELKSKDEQIREKDLQIKELHNLLDQQQQLTALDRKKIVELEDRLANASDQSADQEEETTEQIQKKWWKFWK